MKILILAIPRSGSTTIYESIKSQLTNFEFIFEPWRIGKEKNLDIDSYDNLLIKSLLYQIPLANDTIFRKNSNQYRLIDTLDFYKNLILKFDKVILLSRRDIDNASVSYEHALKYKNWFSKYSTEATPSNNIIRMYKLLTNRIETLGTYMGLKVWYYEELFHRNNSEIVLEFAKELKIKINDTNQFLEYYDIKNKLRK